MKQMTHNTSHNTNHINVNSRQVLTSERKNSKKNYTINDYPDMENSKLILSYGPQVYEYSRYIEGLAYTLKDAEVKLIEVLKGHEVTPQIRTKLIDWLLEVLYAYKCEEATIYLAMHLLDAYFYRSKKKVNNSDIHLIGITCLYIASKFEDLYPLDINTVRIRISHCKFTEKEIHDKEKQILELLDFKIITASTLDFIKNFIYDFLYNNKKVISKIQGTTNITILEETAIYISKLIIHSDIFSGFKSSIKAIACIILAFDIVRVNVPEFNGEIEKFTNEWIKFLVEQSRYEPDHIIQLYNKMKEFYEAFDETPLIQHNLKKNTYLPFFK